MINLRVENQDLFTVIYAEEGKVFQDKESGVIISDIAYLGKEDSPENYIEIEMPVEVISDEQE